VLRSILNDFPEGLLALLVHDARENRVAAKGPLSHLGPGG